jgi:hypothetical protein
MKRIIIITSFLFSTCFVKGQELGLRFGNVSGDANNVAIDGIFSLGEFSRVHADLSLGHNVGLDMLWDFINKPLGTTEGLTYYIGAGPFLIFSDPFYFGAVGEIGLEYKFSEAPIALGLDWRPYMPIIQDFDFYGGGFGLNVRYIFGK